MPWSWSARLAAGVVCLACQAQDPQAQTPTQLEPLEVTAVRFWTQGDVTRIAVEATGEFKYRVDRLQNPDRIYFDVLGARAQAFGKRIHVIPVGNGLLKQIRVAETAVAVTRVVLDLEVAAEYTATQLANPQRLMIELRGSAAKTATPVNPPPAPAVAKTAPSVQTAAIPTPKPVETTPKPSTPAAKQPRSAEPKAAAEPVHIPAQRNRSGDRSLTRVLGLKVSRVLLDPGHGGQDTGTIAVGGLMEKDLVLDIALRLGALIEERMGSEVVYTRTEDEFVPLETRTEIANEKKADLFLSIHANSSSARSIAGVETFYLNFTTSRVDLELAARENAGSQTSIHELSELVRKIAQKDKAEESREFAARIQASLYELSARSNARSKNRGVKKAPFVVLIGATMPSVLTEISFISNPREETLLKRSDHRQRMAEALYKGIQQYAQTLSHTKVAQAKNR